MYKILVLASVISVTYGASEGTDFSHGIQVLGKVVRQFLNSQPEDFKISDGVHIVNTRSENDARAATDDKSLIGTVENYLQTHEVRIKLPELMPGYGFGRAFKDALEGLDGNETGSARKSGGGGLGGGGKGGGGMGGVLVLGLMMGKMMAALGIGGIGLLAMKALMVSALALMLSIVIGLKKLLHHGGDEGGHTVIHASGGGHGHGHEYRRKREAFDMAYSAWDAYKSS